MATMGDSKKIVAPVEELAALLPQHAIVWEMTQTKLLCDRDDLTTSINRMCQRQHRHTCDHNYIANVQGGGFFSPTYRKQVVKLYQTVLGANETVCLAVNLLDRTLAKAKCCEKELKAFATASLVLATKLHGQQRGVTAKALTRDCAAFNAQDAKDAEMLICKRLNWELSVVTASEFMLLLVLYSAGCGGCADSPGHVLRNIICLAQAFINASLREYATLRYTPSTIALCAILDAHKELGYSPKQWLSAVQETNAYSKQDSDLCECWCAVKGNI